VLVYGYRILDTFGIRIPDTSELWYPWPVSADTIDIHASHGLTLKTTRSSIIYVIAGSQASVHGHAVAGGITPMHGLLTYILLTRVKDGNLSGDGR
jgi:hypothetical protein